MVAMEEREKINGDWDCLKRSWNVFGRVSELDARFPIDVGVKCLIDLAQKTQIRNFQNGKENDFFVTLDQDFTFHNQRKNQNFDPI